MTPVNVCQLALNEIGSQVQIASLTDITPQARTAALNYTPRIQSLLRAANWDFLRAQVTLSVFKEALVNGVTSANPPPQPWLFSYLWPSDCIKARFILPTAPVQPAGVPLTTTPNQTAFVPPAPTAIPFVPATDQINNGNSVSPVRVILTNLCNAQLVYTRDLSQYPDQWDPLFLSAATAYLGCYFIQSLQRNKAQYDDQVGITKNLMDQARMANGNEGINSIDHRPDWISARYAGGGWGWGNSSLGGWAGGGVLGIGNWDALGFPCGLRY